MGIGNGIVIKIGSDVADGIRGINQVERALDRNLTTGERFGRIAPSIAAGFFAVGAAAGVMAIKLGRDAVAGAIEDEKSMKSLNKTLENMGFSHASVEADRLISSLQLQYGVADTVLRPALDRLVRSTDTLGQAESALQLAMDISAGTGKDLEAVANALGKAYDGNTGALGKLGVGIDAAVLKSGDMKAITAALSQTFSGQAATAADTYQGRLNRLTQAASEATEQIGYALLGALDDVTGQMGGVGGTQDVIHDLGDAVSEMITGFGLFIKRMQAMVPPVAKGTGEIKAAKEETLDWTDALFNAEDPLSFIGNLFVNAGHNSQVMTERLYDQEAAVNALSLRYLGLANAIAAANMARANAATADRYNALAVREYGIGLSYTGGTLNSYFGQLHQATSATDHLSHATGGSGGATDALDKINPKLQKQIDLTKRHIDQLTGSNGLVARLKDLTDARDDYNRSVTDGLLGNISLADAWSQQINSAATIARLDQAVADALKAGDAEGIAKAQAERSAAGLAVNYLDVFTKQVTDTAGFSSGLTALAKNLGNTPGAQALIDQLRGFSAEQGNAILSGLTVDTARNLAGQLSAVAATVGGNSGLLGGVFFDEGIKAAQNLVDSMADQLEKDEKKLRKIGQLVGQPIGAEIKQAITTAIDEALAAAAARVDPTALGRNVTNAILQGQSRTGR